MKFQGLVACIALLASSSSAWGVQVFQCEDDQGNRTFASACPPGTKQVAEKNYGTGTAPAPAGDTAQISALMYVIPECDVCAQVREYLTLRKIPVAEKNVLEDPALQSELKAKAGHLRVPVTIIGEKVITGYKREELSAALAAAGFVEEGAPAATDATGAGTEGFLEPPPPPPVSPQ